jgi:hypothetical protein
VFLLNKVNRLTEPGKNMHEAAACRPTDGKRDRDTESYWKPGRKRDRQTESYWQPGRKREKDTAEEDRQTESSWRPGRKRDTGKQLEDDQEDMPEDDWVALEEEEDESEEEEDSDKEGEDKKVQMMSWLQDMEDDFDYTKRGAMVRRIIKKDKWNRIPMRLSNWIKIAKKSHPIPGALPRYWYQIFAIKDISERVEKTGLQRYGKRVPQRYGKRARWINGKYALPLPLRIYGKRAPRRNGM